MFKKSYIYCYYIDDINAIKIGYGDNPEARMRDYTVSYGVTGQNITLKKWQLPASGLASNIEKVLHNQMLELGLSRINLDSQGSIAQEIFALNDYDYYEVADLIDDYINTAISTLLAQMQLLPTSEEKEKAKKVARAKQNAGLKREEMIKSASLEIEHARDTIYPRFIEILEEGAAISRSMPFKERGYFEEKFKGKIYYTVEFQKWEGRFKLLDNFEEFFLLFREIKFFILNFRKVYSWDIEKEAEKRANFNITEPSPKAGIRQVSFVIINSKYQEFRGKPELAEVALCADMLAGLGYVNAFNSLKSDNRFKDVVKLAYASPLPELHFQDYI